MNTEELIGFKDQEILIKALVKYLSGKINRSENIVIGLIRMSIAEWAEKHHEGIKALKTLSEEERDRAVEGMMDIFLAKAHYSITSGVMRSRLRGDSLEIYRRWKMRWKGDQGSQWAVEMETVTGGNGSPSV